MLLQRSTYFVIRMAWLALISIAYYDTMIRRVCWIVSCCTPGSLVDVTWQCAVAFKYVTAAVHCSWNEEYSGTLYCLLAPRTVWLMWCGEIWLLLDMYHIISSVVLQLGTPGCCCCCWCCLAGVAWKWDTVLFGLLRCTIAVAWLLFPISGVAWYDLVTVFIIPWYRGMYLSYCTVLFCDRAR